MSSTSNRKKDIYRLLRINASLTGDAVWNTNLDLAVMIANWYPKSTP